MATRNYVEIVADLCKGCRVCVETCPNDCLRMSGEINRLGYEPALFESADCTACGLCFYVCPEPGAIIVYRRHPVEETA